MSAAAGDGKGATAGRAELSKLSFEELLEQLEGLVGQLSSGEVGIEAAADLYEQAGRVYNEAKARLDAVQTRIESLKGQGTA